MPLNLFFVVILWKFNFEGSNCYKRVVQEGLWHGSRTEKKWGSIKDHGNKNFVFSHHENRQVRHFFINLFLQVMYTRNSVWRRQSCKTVKRLHVANRIPKPLSIDNPNHSEDLRLKITCVHRVVKSRITVNYSGSSPVTQDLQATSHKEWFPKFTFHRKFNQLIRYHKNTPVWPSYNNT